MGTVSFMFILILTVVNLFHLSNKFLINYFKYDILTFFILGLLGTLVLKIIIFVVFILIKKELLYGTFYSILTYFHYGLILESVFATFCGTYVWFADFFNLKKSSNILSLIHFYTLLIG